ncbi:hypothetical protein EDC01DRAFT_694357 [Geopyxis carbonaria]|nr:hypothetical protein EDC01DRAFT_694357 [Geopyxis carbonaria]
MSSPPSDSPIITISDLENLIDTYPLIDNHAHPLLKDLEPHADEYQLESITSEAHGSSLQDTKHSLSHRRAVRQLAKLYDCEPTWDAVKATRQKRDVSSLAADCFAGIQCILFDDGLDKRMVLGYREHDQFTFSPNRRIVRIEKVAEEVLEKMMLGVFLASMQEEIITEHWTEWSTGFMDAITKAINDREVVGFKSVICYRTGLEIETREDLPTSACALELNHWIEEVLSSCSFRLQSKVLNDWVVNTVCKALKGKNIPLQFHTGLGDNDINLLKSNPACMQEFIKKYPDIQFVLLHAAYPYTREAGYLAAVYKNVYLDFGEVFPVVSKDGQKSVIKQMLELTPANKLLWSTDGHWFPETFALANIQMREIIREVLVKRVKTQVLTLDEAAYIVKMIFFENSNNLYRLKLKPNLAIFSKSRTAKRLPLDENSASELGYEVPSVRHEITTDSGEGAILEEFLQKNPDIEYIRIQWVDYAASVRLRVLPLAVVLAKIKNNNWDFSIPKAGLDLLQDDTPLPNLQIEGKYRLVPQWNSLRNCTYANRHAAVMCEIRSADHTRIDICPRTSLIEALEKANKHDIDFLVGFETEVVFLGEVSNRLINFDKAHSWSAASALTPKYQAVMDEIVKALLEDGIEVIMYHPESADGQFEVVTGPLSPLAAVDALYHTRQTIWNIASKHHFHATFHPKPYANQIGTAAHTHISLGKGKAYQSEFIAGIIRHLQAICAFGLPSFASYERSIDNCWSGGTWVCWGDENRETPLRRISEADAHWEIRCIDATANMYLFISAVINAGILGVRQSLKLPPVCPVNPAEASLEIREELGITRSLPGTLGKAINFLQQDKELVDALGASLCEKHCVTKKAEINKMENMDKTEADRHSWELWHY